MNRVYCYTLILVLLISGCTTVPMADPAKDSALKSFAAKPNVASIYVYRNETMGGAIRMDVSVDGKVIGQTVAKTYLYTEVEPGPHTITSLSENTDRLDLDVVAGHVYYIWQEAKMGILYARTKLHLVTDDEGQKGVNETKLAQGNQ